VIKEKRKKKKRKGTKKKEKKFLSKKKKNLYVGKSGAPCIPFYLLWSNSDLQSNEAAFTADYNSV